MNDDKYTNPWEAFVRLLAHDIKGPVGNTVMFSGMAVDQLDQLLEEKPELEPQLDMVRSLVANVETVNQKLMHQVQAWVEAYEIQYGQMQWSVRELDIESVCQNLKSLNATYLQKKQLVLEFYLDETEIEFDEQVLERMLDLMLTIFITYAESNQTIQLKAISGSDEAIRFELHDELTAERPELSERLSFDDDIPENYIPGNGILKPSDFGLLYIKKVCDEAQGECGFDATEDGGMFWIELPRKAAVS